LQSYSFIKITRKIFSLKEKFEFIVVFFLLLSWMAVLVCFILFFRKKIVVSFIIILSLVLNGAVLKDPLKRSLIFLKNFHSHDNSFSFSI